jgi:hypothetical protein
MVDVDVDDKYPYTLQCHQAWLAGKSPKELGASGFKSSTNGRQVSAAMFDYLRVYRIYHED